MGRPFKFFIWNVFPTFDSMPGVRRISLLEICLPFLSDHHHDEFDDDADADDDDDDDDTGLSTTPGH